MGYPFLLPGRHPLDQEVVPACTALLEAAAQAGEPVADVPAYTFLRGIGNLCAGASQDPNYGARAVVRLLLAGLRQQPFSSGTKPAAKTTAAKRGCLH